MVISSFNAVFDSSVKRDCCERYSASLLCALRAARGYHLISSDARDVKKIYPLALRILAGLAAFTLLLPFTMLGAVLHQFSITHRTNYARYIAQHSVSPGQSQSAPPQENPLPPSQTDKNDKAVTNQPVTNKDTLPLAKDFPPGVFRKGNGQGTLVTNLATGLKGSKWFVMEQQEDMSYIFATCFHTTESQEEIWTFIQKTCSPKDPTRQYGTSYPRLRTNLVHLLDALPGEPQSKKSSKIYWNDQAAKVLFPYFFENENVDIETLVFMISPGENQKGDWQADNMDFTQQLQFVGIKGAEGEHQPFVPPVENQGKEANPLMLRAHAFTQRNYTEIT